MTQGTGWSDTQIDPTKRVKDLAKELKKLAGKFAKLAAEAQKLAYDNPLGELLKCTDIPELAKLQVAAESCYDIAHSANSPAHGLLEAVRKNVLPQVMENAQVEKVRVTGVGTVSIRSDLFVTSIKDTTIKAPPLDAAGDPIVDAQADDFVPIDYKEWLIRGGHGSLIQDTVNASSLKALVKGMIKDGKEVPSELFKTTPVSYSVILKK